MKEAGEKAKGPAVLIVEDEAKMRRLLELNLGEDGFTTLSTGDAEAGLKLLRENPVDLVLTDLKLPGMNGLEFLQAIKRQNPGFNERAHGFRAFNELLLEAQKRGLVKLEDDKQAGTYIVHPIE